MKLIEENPLEENLIRIIDINQITKDIHDQKNESREFFNNMYSMEKELITQLISMRKKSGLSQQDIARKSGLTQQMISKIEKMGYYPRLDTLLKYIVALGVNISINTKKY